MLCRLIQKVPVFDQAGALSDELKNKALTLTVFR
jgi:hypothetical protein